VAKLVTPFLAKSRPGRIPKPGIRQNTPSSAFNSAKASAKLSRDRFAPRSSSRIAAHLRARHLNLEGSVFATLHTRDDRIASQTDRLTSRGSPIIFGIPEVKNCGQRKSAQIASGQFAGADFIERKG
jgi:hypothetical protein